MTVHIQLAEDTADIEACFPLMLQLRPQLLVDEWLQRVILQRSEHYQLALLRDGRSARSCAGFRIHTNLFAGRHMYVDDLVSDETVRGAGYGQQLLGWLKSHARAQGCGQLHLDSGVQRFAAHKFYLMQGMRISSHHFQMDL